MGKTDSPISSCALCLAMLAFGCVDLRPPVPASSYRAVVSVESKQIPAASIQAQTRLSEFYASGKLRREFAAEDEISIFIDRPDLRVRWVLDPTEKSFDEQRLFDLGAPTPWLLNPFGSRAKADFELIGKEEVAGTPARKYQVRGERDPSEPGRNICHR